MLSGIVTLLLMLLFIAIWAWAWQPRHRSRFDDAARLAARISRLRSALAARDGAVP